MGERPEDASVMAASRFNSVRRSSGPGPVVGRRVWPAAVVGVGALVAVTGILVERAARQRDLSLEVSGRDVDLQGATVRVYEWGPAEASPPLVVLLPGAGDTAMSWSLVSRAVGGSRRVMSYDRPGMGYSTPASTTDMAGLVEHLDQVLTAASPESSVLLVSHSFGGLVARAYAAVHADRVAGLVLVDATPPAIAKDRGVRAGFAASAVLAKVLKALAPIGLTRALLAARIMPLYPEQRAFQAAADAEAYRRWVAAVVQSFAGNAGRELAAVLPGAAHLSGRVTQAPSVPVAVVHSRAYGAKWEQMQRDVAAELNARATYATDASHHNIHMTRPDLVAAAIEDVVAG